MKIAIEAQRIFRKNKHGMDFVALETIRALQKVDHENEYFILVQPGEDRCLSATNNFHIIEIKCPTYILWEQLMLPLSLAKIKPHVIHCTSNTAPLYLVSPLVLTLHDIIFLEKKSGGNSSLYQRLGRIYRRWVVPRIVYRSKKIITVSEYERTNILQTLRLNPQKLVNIYNGLSPIFKPDNVDRSIVKKYVSADSYMFFLGNTDPKKNTTTTLKAYSIYLQQSKVKRSLLVADLNENAIDTILEQEGIKDIKPYLFFPGYIPNQDLPYIYVGASVFLYPSLRESFGLPLLEAMASGTPVVTSCTSAIPEIAGEGAVLVHPSNAEEIANQLIRLETDEAYYDNCVKYGIERASMFSWKQTAEELLNVYLKLKTRNDD